MESINDKKRILINLFATLIAFAVQFGINFFLTPYIINSLGSEAYSFIPLTNNIVGFTNIITVAFYSMTGRFLALSVGQGDMERAKTYFNSSTIANCVLALVLLLPSCLVTLAANHLINIPPQFIVDVKITFAFSFINMCLSLALSTYSAVYFVTNRMDLSAKRNIEGNVLRAIILIALFSFLAPKIYFLNATMLLVTVYLVLTNVRYTHKLLPSLKLNFSLFRFSAVKDIVGAGIWNSLNQTSTILLSSLDLFLSNLIMGTVVTGQYSVAKTVPNFVQSIILTLVPVFMPQLTLLFAKRNREQLFEGISFGTKIIGLFSSIPIGFLLVFGKQFFQLWVPSQDASLLQGLSTVTLLALMITCPTSMTANVFTVTNRLRVPALVLLGLGIGNTAAAIILMKFTPLGIWSVPVAALFVAILHSLLFTPLYAARCLNASPYFAFPAIIKAILCTATMTIVCAIYHFLIPANSWILLFIAGICCMIISTFINFYIVFNKEERKSGVLTLKEKLHIK